MNNIFQCCYTNDINDIKGNISSGWRTVAVSPDIPQDALETCEKLQNANSVISSNMTDEFGNVLSLDEISGDGNYIYVIRTKYGMLDRLGRANMFSHAFIFPCRDTASVEDPNIFLTIAEENFKDNKEEAERICNMPDVAVTDEGYHITDVLCACQISSKEYKALLNCVYVHVAEKKIPEPLFVEYDGTLRNRRGLLYCIYYGLPLSVRRRLSVASCPTTNTGEKNIIFTVNAKGREHYIIPRTGENNVLSPRLEKRLSRYGFVDYAAGNYMNVGFENYFTTLETKVIELGDETAHDKLFLKIAHLLITEQGSSSLQRISDSELDARLSDALRTQSVGNVAMDAYIGGLLDEIRQRKLILTDEMETLLANRADLSAEASQPVMVPVSQSCPDAKEKDDDTWEKMEKELSDHNNEIAKRAWELYNKELSNIRNGEFDAIAVYNHYISIVKKIFRENVEQYAVEAKIAYWEKIDFGRILFSELEQYRELKLKDIKSETIILYATLPAVLQNSGERTFFRSVGHVFLNIDKLIGSGRSDKVLARKRLLKYIKAENYSLDESFDIWYTLVCSIPQTAINLFFEMYDAFREGRRETLWERYRKFCDICEEHHVDRDIQNQFEVFIKEECGSACRD